MQQAAAKETLKIPKHAHEPLIRLAKREDMPASKRWAIRLGSIALALVIGSLFIGVLGHNPVAVYGDIVNGSLGTGVARSSTVRMAIPLLGAALAIAPAFKMKFWNIGAEGQIMMGAIFATYFALFWAGKMPSALLLTVMFLAAALGGGIWGLIPAYFKAKWGTNETLLTLMFNYIALGLQRYLQGGPWKDPAGTGFPIIAMFSPDARLPKLLGVHVGWVIVLAIMIFMFVYMRWSKQGYEISVVGESQRTARYAGMNVSKIIMRTMFLSGAIAGIVGMLVVSGADFTLNTGTSGGVGFTAITVAWLAQLNPFGMLLMAFFLAMLGKGANTIQTNFKIPASAAKVLTGIILFSMLASEFFIQYRMIFRKKHREEVIKP